MPEMNSVSESTANWALQRQLALSAEAQTGSTNDDAKTAAMSEDSDFVLYLAAHQTTGRGRGGNHWLDTGAGESLLSTWSFQLSQPPQAITAPRVGLGLYQAARRTWPSLNWALKAPNDLFLGGRKVAGLLIESVSHGHEHRVLIGLGFNILNHPRLIEDATHLADALTQVPDEGDWFRFLDELRQQWQQALDESTKPTLTDAACTELLSALNANPNRKIEIAAVSPQGDLTHAGGVLRWTDL